MREKYETLSLTSLRDIAKARGIKRVTGVKKAELIDSLCALDDQEKASAASNEDAKAKKAADTKKSTERKKDAESKKSAENKKGTKNAKAVKTVTTEKEADKPARKNDKIEDDSSKAQAPASEKNNSNAQAKKSNHTQNTPKEQQHKSRRIIQVNGNSQSKAASSSDQRKPSSMMDQRKSAPGMDQRKPAPGMDQRKSKAASDFRKQPPKKDIANHDQDAPKETESSSEPMPVGGIIEIMSDGFGFIRSENYLPGENDIYIAPAMIRKFGLRTGDILSGTAAKKSSSDKFAALIQLDTINGYTPEESIKRFAFQKMTPVFPDKKLGLEYPGAPVSMRIMDLIDPIGKGQRGMIVSPPKAGKTTLLKDVAKSIKRNFPDMHIIILLIDERPEEVTDIKESIEGPNVEVIYSTFDELPEHHTRVAEMTIEHARRLVEHRQDVTILIDSITRLTRAYNQVVPPSGRTLSGGLDPAALHMPKRFFGAARNMREGGSLTILATALIETGSKMDDVVYEEFKGTGNMEMILDRKLQEKRIFPAINIAKSSTRREDLLLTSDELNAVNRMRKSLNGLKADDAADQILNNFSRTRSNKDFITLMNRRIF